jgi:hypothetical protein
MNTCIRNIGTPSTHVDFSSPRRGGIHQIIQRMKSPLKRNGDTATPRRRMPLQKLVDKLVISQGFSNKVSSKPTSPYISNPTDFQKSSYGSAVTAALHSNLTMLRALFEAGVSPNPYDTASRHFLVHTVCNNVNVAALKLMIQYGGPEIVQCIDTYGRTPLHNVCWNIDMTATDDRLEIVKILLQCDPQMLYIKDCRGSEALSYIPECQYSQWMSFFTDIKSDIWYSSKSIVGKDMLTSVVQHPTKIIPGDIASMLASGRMDPDEVKILQYENILNQNDNDTEIDFNDIFCNPTKNETMFFDSSCLLLDDDNNPSDEKNSTNDISDSSFGESNELADILDSISVEGYF